MANPRKFSEKIALQKQKQAEGTAEFEKIMNEVKATRILENSSNFETGTTTDTSSCSSNQLQQQTQQHHNRHISGGSGGGSGTSSGASGGGASPDANINSGGSVSMGGSPTTYRESRGRSVGVGPMRRPSERKQERSPYGSTNSGGMSLMANAGGSSAGGNGGLISQNTQTIYLSPPMDSNWRRSNSDSALHQTLCMTEEGNYATSGIVGTMTEMNSLQANYSEQHHQNMRSHSPNDVRCFSPQAAKRKQNLLQRDQQQSQEHQQQQFLHHQRLQMQQQQQLQQQQQHHQQLHQHHHGQQTLQHPLHQIAQQQQFNMKYCNSNVLPNAIFKPLQEQQLNFANTGSLPDLTSVHYMTTTVPETSANQVAMPILTDEQATLSPPVITNSVCLNRDQSSRPFSPNSGGGGVGGGASSPALTYCQQGPSSQLSAAPNSTSTSSQRISPHMSFVNLTVTPGTAQQMGLNDSTYHQHTTLPTLGATGRLSRTSSNSNNNATGCHSDSNMTEYRQPLNPPSPGSSPGLLNSSNNTNEMNANASAPPSPIRQQTAHLTSTIGTSVGNAHNANDNQLTTNLLQNAFANMDSNSSSFNVLNPAFQNHFEQFHLGDSNQSPQNNYEGLEFEDMVPLRQTTASNGGLVNRLTSFGNIITSTAICPEISTISANSSDNYITNNDIKSDHDPNSHSQSNQKTCSNSSSSSSVSGTNINDLNASKVIQRHMMAGSSLSNQHGDNVNTRLQHDAISAESSPMPSLPTSPLPIPMPAHSPHQLSLSVQTSPHHSPLHSPHHTPSPLSVSSPGLTMLGCNAVDSVSSSASVQILQQNHLVDAQQHRSQLQQQQQQQQHPQSHVQHITTSVANTTIPQIIFSDYSSSRDIFDNLDLDLGQIDEPGLQILTDQSPIMITDLSCIEDNFRRDLN